MRLVDYFVVVGLGTPILDEGVNPLTEPGDILFRGEIQDCFPDADTHPGCPLPEHIAHFAFPAGMTLQTAERAPTMFHFVLTNVSGVKMYGVSLNIYEELGTQTDMLKERADQAIALSLEHGQGMCDRDDLPSWLKGSPHDGDEPLFAPKALLLLSHYPFYSAYSQFLQQLYRISLSEAPLPIERYLSNFVCEVPLPPQGNVEVMFALPDRILRIKRPPKNRLPLVDFSYRPLFAALSVENILTAMACLLSERQLALCSSHCALLNPVAEALLSLLFPFVWQGAYIPVMPLSMTDMLEAPVPFLVGLDSSYLERVPTNQRPQGVVFIDIDSDAIDLGDNPEKGGRVRKPHMPDRETNKLRQKLNEFGGMVHWSRCRAAIPSGGISIKQIALGDARQPEERGNLAPGYAELDKIDLAFPNGEHLLPISTFATEVGLRGPLHDGKKAGDGMIARLQRRKRMAAAVGRTMGLKQKAGGQPGKEKDTYRNLLDPANNFGAADGFNAHEVRAACLRFFVSIFRNYQNYTLAANNPEDHTESLFDRELFLKESSHLPESCHAFMAAFLGSQMFERFMEERSARPNQPEIRFFEESILAKLNRSKTNPIKHETPFLSDTMESHSQTFSPPPPSNWGLPDDGTTYSYDGFPGLCKERYGNVRWARRLFKTPDQHRNIGSANHQEMLSRKKLMRPRGGKHRLERRPQKEKSMYFAPAALELDKVLGGVACAQALWRGCAQRSRSAAESRAAEVIARWWELRQCTHKERLAYLATIRQATQVQRIWRGWRGKREAQLRLSMLLLLQRWLRMVIVRAKYQRKKGAALVLQSVARMDACRTRFLIIRQYIVLGQAAVRGWTERRMAAKQRIERLAALRAQIFELWGRTHAPLTYRSRFWVLFQGSGFFDVAIHEEEALRLWRELSLVEHDKDYLTRMRFMQLFQYVDEWLVRSRGSSPEAADDTPVLRQHILWRGKEKETPERQRPRTMRGTSSKPLGTMSVGLSRSALAMLGVGRRASTASVPTALSSHNTAKHSIAKHRIAWLYHLEIFAMTCDLSCLGSSSNQAALATLATLAMADTSPFQPPQALASAQAALEAEREALYKELKSEAGEGERTNVFHMFGLERQKKRKRKLVGLLWKNREFADASADVVLTIFNKVLETRADWVKAKRDSRIRADMLCTVQACIASIQLLKQELPRHSRSARHQRGSVLYDQLMEGKERNPSEERRCSVVGESSIYLLLSFSFSCAFNPNHSIIFYNVCSRWVLGWEQLDSRR
ncbi:unnamed protein product [Chrysoparadoxa australica]